MTSATSPAGRTSATSSEVHEERKFLLEVSFHEPGVIECEPVLKSLKDFSNLVRNIVTVFEPLLTYRPAHRAPPG